MGILKPITEWATSPWGQNVPIHIAWFLIWVAALAGLLFLIVHAIYVRYFAKAEQFAGDVSPTLLPDHFPEADPPPEWLYFQIWTEIRAELHKPRP